MAKTGAGFAGFATWLDMTPADADMFVIPDPDSLIQLPWKKEVGWFAGNPWMDGKEVEHAPRNVLRRTIAAAAAQGFEMKAGVECEFFLDRARRQHHCGCRRPPSKAVLRPVRADAPLRRDRGNLRRDAGAGLEPVPERPLRTPTASSR